MRYILILILSLAAIWYFFLRAEPPKPLEPLPTPTPMPVRMTAEEQFLQVLAGTPVDASKLGRMCSAYPALAPRLLQNRQFQLAGTIADIRLSGLNGRKAEVLLHSEGSKRIVVVFDMDRYVRTTVSERAAGKFAIIDTELLWVPRDGAGQKRVLVSKESRVQWGVTTQSIGATNIVFVAPLEALRLYEFGG